MPRRVPVSTVRLEIFGDKVVQRQLFRGAQVIADPRPAFELMAEDVMEIIRLNFESGGRRGGGSWKGLSPATILRKASAGQDPRPLIATGALMDSMTVRDAPHQNLKITKSSIRLSSELPYAETQQFGTSDGHVPARPYLKFSARDRQGWTRMVADEIMEAMRV